MDAGYPPSGTPTLFLDIHIGLAYAPESGKEVSPKLLIVLLQAGQEKEVPRALNHQVMKDAFSLRAVPPTSGEESFPPSC
ncbi:UNVERIFIED_CONTAM: hypothetical protein Sradi_5284000 [Sesamum radiatum]|uniref:Uncharacterized protein n=1 Tax=Sesamum radiatum TaxID=300843 RepID=A0AAW2LM61_SESRA